MCWRPCRQTLIAALAAASVLAWLPGARAAETINIVLDQAQILRMPDRVGTIVVGNPLIADVSMQAGGLLIVTGKGYGRTNVIALDRAGKVLLETAVQVEGPPNVVVVYRGGEKGAVDRESYSCTPTCERRITLGDAKTYFEDTLQQTGSRNGQATGSGQTASR